MTDEDEDARRAGAEESFRLSLEVRVRNLETALKCVEYVLNAIPTAASGVEEEKLIKARQWLTVQLRAEKARTPST